MHTAQKVIATGLGSAALALGMLSPAQAEVTRINDGADSAATLNDVLTVRLAHTTTKVRVRTTYQDLRKTADDGGASSSIFLDTKPARPGPEYVLLAGLQLGTDYQLVRVKDWKPTGEPKTCAHDFAVDFAKDVTRLVVSRPCLGNPKRVRVSQRVTDMADASHPVRDWAPARREFSAWVRPGK
ncbi:hypothetical protein NODU109028_06710 [Nocardioides dubius]|uniref:Uncharacterized protein n=1 Tax=Nocardioides dubius TaxID=317019 RepID=A0ABP4EAI7_9ACTN